MGPAILGETHGLPSRLRGVTEMEELSTESIPRDCLVEEDVFGGRPFVVQGTGVIPRSFPGRSPSIHSRSLTAEDGWHGTMGRNIISAWRPVKRPTGERP